MNRTVPSIFLRFSLAGGLVLLGYAVAVLSFRQETWIDYHSGAIRMTYRLFPLSLSADDNTNAFRILFGRSPSNKTEWGIVCRRSLISWLDRDMLTEGEGLLRAEHRLVMSLLLKRIDCAEREEISREFYSALSNGGLPAAEEYASRMYMEQTARENERIEKRSGKERGEVGTR
jgi:hypothetical protein